MYKDVFPFPSLLHHEHPRRASLFAFFLCFSFFISSPSVLFSISCQDQIEASTSKKPKHEKSVGCSSARESCNVGKGCRSFRRLRRTPWSNFMNFWRDFNPAAVSGKERNSLLVILDVKTENCRSASLALETGTSSDRRARTLVGF